MKTIKDCLKFANENKVCALATLENGQPKVRVVSLWFADETGFYFQTDLLKEFPHQIERNPDVEVCFFRQEIILGCMLRVTGEVEFLNDVHLKERALKERPHLEYFKLDAKTPVLVIFRIPHGKIYYWRLNTNLKPKMYIDF